MIKIKANSFEEVEAMVKKEWTTISEHEEVRITTIKEAKKILFLQVKGLYNVEIVPKEIRKAEKKEVKKEKAEVKSTTTKLNTAANEKKTKQQTQTQNNKTQPKEEKKIPKKAPIKEQPKAEKKEEITEVSKEHKPKIERIRNFFEAFIQTSKLDIKIEAIKKEHDKYIVFLDGRDVRYLIGEKGSTLNSLEHLLGVVNDLKDLRVLVDSNDYKKKREEALRELARKKGQKVLETGKTIKLNPMVARERKIIHEEISYMQGLITESHGEEPKRCLVIKKVR